MSKKKKKLWDKLSQRTKILIAAGAGGGLVVALLVGLLVLINNNPSGSDPVLTEEQKNERDRNVNQAERDAGIRQSASEALQQGNTEKVSQVYTDAINSESDTARKVQLYVDQSRLLYSSGKIEDAIRIAKEAESQTDDKFIIADWLARLYEDQKQYSLAVQYFTLASQSVNSPNNVYLFDKAHYDKQIARVSALEKQR